MKGRNKMTNDFGEKIGGSKKQLLTINIKKKVDFNKSTYWKRPDYKKLVENGLPNYIAYWQMKMRDAVPSYTEQISCSKYKTLTEELKNSVEAVDTDEKVLNFYESFFYGNGWVIKEDGKVLVEPKASKYLSTKLFRAGQVSNINNLKKEMNFKNFLNKKEVNGDETLTGTTPEDILSKNIKGCQFGASMPEKEKVFHLNNANKALEDLADVLGISKDCVGMGNSLCFGTRGKAYVKAHFEQEKFIINLSRKSGAGSFAHEWAHSLDNYIANYFNLTGMASTYAYETGDNLIKTNLPKFTKFINELYFNEEEYSVTRYHDMLFLSKLDCQYLSKPTEMFARMFACYIKDKLAEKGIANKYLCGACEEREFTYPTENERKHFAECFEEALVELKYWNILKEEK